MLTMSRGIKRMGLRVGMVLLASLALAACGGGGGSSSGSGSTTPPPTVSYTLSVSVSGNGSVSSNPAGISCGSSCSASFNSGTQVTLTATAASGYTFSGWGGACSDSSTCTITMNQAQSVSANFTASAPSSYTLSVSVSGNGSVSSSPAGINCGSTCSASFNSGTQVTLTATPASGATFSGWGGACAGTSTTCTVTMSQAQSVSAGFASASGGGFPATTAINLCSGIANTGNSPVPYGVMAKPAVGVPFTNQFGARVIRITDAQTTWNSSIAVPSYPTTQAWNSDETYLILYVSGPLGTGGHEGDFALFNGKTYQFIRFLNINPADVEQYYWSTTNPDILYYVDNHQSGSTSYAQLTAYDVATNTKTVLHDFAQDMQPGGALAGVCPYEGFMHVSGGEDPFAMSENNTLLGLGCYLGKNGPTGGAAFEAFSYNLSTGQIGKPFLVESDVPQALPSGSGTYFYNSTNDVQVLDAATNQVLQTIAFDGTQHSDMLRNAAGDDLVAGVQFDGPSGSGTLMWANLTKGGAVHGLLTEANSGYPRSGTLLSGRAYKNPGWIAEAITGCPAGTNGNCNGSQPVAASNPQTYLDQEILVANLDSGVVCRVAHNRTAGDYGNAAISNYWAQPNVVISPSGTRILFDSDWGAGNPANVIVNPNAVVDTYVIELPTYQP